MNKSSFIYFRDNEWFIKEDIIKLGITSSIIERGDTYITGEIYRGKFIKIYKLNIKLKHLNLLDKLIKKKFIDFNVYYGGGTEFYKKDVMNYIEDYLSSLKIDYELFNEEDLKRLNRKRNITYDYKRFYDKLIINNNIILRDYQIKIINEGYELLKLNNKLYLELATGAGKSLISYKLINLLKPSNIIIFTPRIDICQQNRKEEYIKNLDYNYNNLICACIQSFNKIYEIIINENLNDIFIWFDEAHYGLDIWINETNEIKNFLLKDTSQIKYRLFTTASPNKEEVYKNKNIYGDLYSPIKISKLIKENWLCNIKVHIYKEDYQLNFTNNQFIKFLLNFFINPNINIGMCFNNTCDIAFIRFNIHLDLYINNETNIKPYLLLNDDYISKLEIDKNFTDINRYNQENTNAISYIVDKYSMGYDNKLIDLLVFPDPKYSNEDIIQKIGRGLRPDGLGLEGRNLNKINNILLPVYINDDEEKRNKYERIEKILIYLIIDLELDIFNKNNKILNNHIKLNSIGHLKIQNHQDIYEFDIDIQTIIYDIYKKYKWNMKRISNQLANNKIYNYKEYLRYIKENPYLNLPKELFRYFPEFNFYYTYKFDICPYYNKDEIKTIIIEYMDDLIEFDEDDDEIIKYLHKKDKRIPDMCLWYFYGGIREDYFS